MNRLLIFISICAASSLLAEPSDDEVAKLRESYTKAVERATAPLTATYIAELKKIMEKHTKAGNLDAALAARKEIESLSLAGRAPSGSSSGLATTDSTAIPATSKTRLSTAEKKRIESYFVGKTWATLGPNGSEITELQYFARNGTGARKVNDVVTTNLKWAIGDDGIVKVTEAGFPKEISFVNADRATMMVHAAPPKGDLKQELKLSSETIPGAK